MQRRRKEYQKQQISIPKKQCVTIFFIQGGRWSAGFWGGFASSALSPFANSASTLEGKVALSAIAGGTASELGGGKFANGAVTAAFVMMYNEMGHRYTKVQALTPAEMRGLEARFNEPGLTDVSELFVPVGRLISGIYNALKVAVGPFNVWVRVGDSYSKVGGFQTKAIRWGSNRYYREQIGSDTLRNLNETLHNSKIPIDGWRTQDAGHFHLWKRE